ncbi:MAG TPA: ABC transporter substrate-binding protein, partial [Mycobacteriales bacterium]|nr:ABC transporter substrate-binding protein [Mycobacteriales bacterium]
TSGLGGVPGPAGSGTTGGTSGTASTGTTGAGAAGTTGAAPGIAEKGRGWDARTVSIGVVTQKDAQRAFETVGVKGLNTGDQEAAAKAVAAELNRHGGLLGRRVTLVFRDQGTVATAQNPTSAGEQACTFFTQDHPVIAVLNPVTLLDVPSFRSCMAKARVPLLSLSVQGIDAKALTDLAPYYYSGVAPAWDALAPVLVQQLQGMGYFTGWNPRTGTAGPNPVRTGLLIPDDVVGHRIVAILTSRLAQAGQKDPVTFFYSTADVANAMPPAVLQFSGNGVTHVLTVNADLLPFQLSASSQGYRPRYGVTSYGAPQAELESNSPRGQNNGAMGVGWSPSLDVSDGNDPGVTGRGERDCLALQKRAGQSFGGKRLAEAVAFAFCDGMQLVGRAAQLGGGFTAPQLYQGVLRAASTFSPAISFASALGPNRLFVPGGVRRLAFGQDCSCFRYQSRTTYRLA